MNINIERSGMGEKIVFIHGSGMSGSLWYKQKDALKNNLETILVDLPGHGKSSGDGCNSVEEYRDVVRDVIKNNSLERCYIAGHSLGGAIAISFALTYPELLKGVLLIGTGARLRVLPKILDEIRIKKDEIVKFIIDYSFSDKTEQEVKDSFFKEMMKCDENVIFKDFNSCNNFDVMDKVKEIDLPTLIICGTEDKLTPPKYSHYLHNEIKGSKLILIENAGHMVMVEKPEETNQSILKFIGGTK